jgi:HK97 family phage major capsid protein
MEDELKTAVADLGRAFEEFKATHAAQIREVREKGVPDPLTSTKLAKIEADLDQLEALKKRLEAMEVKADRPQFREDGSAVTPEQRSHVTAFVSWLRDPNDGQKAAELRQAQIEAKAISSSTASAGHAIPEIIGRRIQETLQLESPMRQVVDVISVGSSDYKELVDVNGETYGWVGETDERSATATGALEQVAPTMGEIYAYPQIYEHVLDDALFDLQGWLISKVVRAFSRGEAIGFLSGNGTNKPTGFLTGTPVATGDFDARAFGDLQYVPTGDAGALPSSDPGDILIDTIHALRPRWRMGAIWLMNTTTKGAIRKWKDADGNYLLRPGLEVGEGNRLLGYPITELDHMPDVGADTFPIAFGNFREAYLAVERTGLRITVDDNITAPGSIKFYVRKRLGGKLRQDQAIKLIKAAAA